MHSRMHGAWLEHGGDLEIDRDVGLGRGCYEQSLHLAQHQYCLQGSESMVKTGMDAARGVTVWHGWRVALSSIIVMDRLSSSFGSKSVEEGSVSTSLVLAKLWTVLDDSDPSSEPGVPRRAPCARFRRQPFHVSVWVAAISAIAADTSISFTTIILAPVSPVIISSVSKLCSTLSS